MNIRKITGDDSQKLLNFFTDLVHADQERVERVEDAQKTTLEDEAKWIKDRLEAEQQKEMFVLCCEESDKIIAEGEVERLKRWVERHVAEIRFGVLPGFEMVALEMVGQLTQTAKQNGIEVLVFFHFSTQKDLEIIKKAGFSESGVIKRYYKIKDNYIDRVYFSKIL